MKFMLLIVGFTLLCHVKSQLDIDVADIIYGEDDEEEDEEVAVTTRATTARTTTTTTIPTTVVASLAAAANLTNSNTTTNYTFVFTPSNGTFFGSELSVVSNNTGPTTERVQYVLGQVGNIWNNVGKLNITGIIDHSLGIRNHYLARPLVTGILNAVFCNPLAFNDNNCKKRGKDGGTSSNDKNSTSVS